MKKELISIDWISHLLSNVFLGFTSPDGQALIDISEDYLFQAPVSWLFHPTTVGYQEIKALVLTMSEAGLIDHWRKLTLREMKIRANLPKPDFQPKPEVQKLFLFDLVGVFRLFCLALLLTVFVFCAELLILRVNNIKMNNMQPPKTENHASVPSDFDLHNHCVISPATFQALKTENISC